MVCYERARMWEQLLYQKLKVPLCMLSRNNSEKEKKRGDSRPDGGRSMAGAIWIIMEGFGHEQTNKTKPAFVPMDEHTVPETCSACPDDHPSIFASRGEIRDIAFW